MSGTRAMPRTVVAATRPRREITETLHACHDGGVPHDIGFLAWLYLAEVLRQPRHAARPLNSPGESMKGAYMVRQRRRACPLVG